jgi:Ser/Thr protein kinase RdoA (MazF antagonist)
VRLDSPRVSCLWIEAAGEALGDLHVASAGRFGRIRSQRAVVSALARVEGRLRDLCERALLGPDDAARMLGVARTWAPARAATGLAHGDYCGENLVLSEGSVVAIDNESLGVGALDYDLARTWTRWPLGAAQARALYRGYGRHRSPAAFECHLPFWAMAALADSACFRARAGSAAVSGTVARLRRLMDRAGERSGQTWSLMDWPSARALDP